MRAVLENQFKELEKELPRSYASRRDFVKGMLAGAAVLGLNAIFCSSEHRPAYK